MRFVVYNLLWTVADIAPACAGDCGMLVMERKRAHVERLPRYVRDGCRDPSAVILLGLWPFFRFITCSVWVPCLALLPISSFLDLDDFGPDGVETQVTDVERKIDACRSAN